MDSKKNFNCLREDMKRYYNSSEEYLKCLNNHRDCFYTLMDFFKKKFKFNPKQKILEVGCGDGYFSYLIAKNNPSVEVIGIDISNKFVRYAKKNFKLPNLKFMVDDCLETKFKKNYFDYILCNDVLEHIPDISVFLNETDRMLKINGLLMIFGPNMLTPFRPSFKESIMNSSLLFKKLISNEGFTYTSPILDDSIQTGKDADCVYVANLIDLLRYYKKKDYKILNKNFPERTIANIFPFLSPLFSIGLIAKKL